VVLRDGCDGRKKMPLYRRKSRMTQFLASFFLFSFPRAIGWIVVLFIKFNFLR
jgi:hypothetical protein